MDNILTRIAAAGVVPVVKLEEAEKAVPLARAVLEGGLNCIEITFRTDSAAESIKRIRDANPDMLLGAGTVTNTGQVDSALEAGADFIVAPGFNPTVAKHCLNKGVAYIPGVATPSEIEAAMELGLSTLKFFPAENSGGLAMLKALSAPYKGVKFVPTGGISLKNLNEYLSLSCVAACGGSWMIKAAALEANDFSGITEAVAETMKTMMGFELRHIGINGDDEKDAADIASYLSKMLQTPYKPGNSSDFAGDMVEVMKGDGLGKHGHIAFSTNNLERAVAYMSSRGYLFDEETSKYNDTGKRIAVYFQREVGGFAIHLVQKQ